MEEITPGEEKKVNLSAEQAKIIHSKRVNFPVSPYEIGIIKALRKMNYGQLTVHFLQGVPIRYTIGASVNVDPLEDEKVIKESGLLNGQFKG